MLAALWWLSSLPGGGLFWISTRRVAQSQRAYLERLLRDNLGCAYFRHHGLSSTELGEFRQRLPLVDYADLEPWVERIGRGEQGVLTRERVLMLEPTSGTQSVKLIPYTRGLRREFQRGVEAWVSQLFVRVPRLLRGGRAYWSITPPLSQQRRSSGGLPIGFEDDAAYLSRSSQWLVRRLLAVTRPLPPQETLEQLLHCPDLSLVSVWSPSYWLLLMERLQQQWSHWKSQSALRQRMERAEVEGLQALWPRLACLSCWGDGPSAPYLDKIRQSFPHTHVQPKGLLATEAFCSLPWEGRKGAALALTSHFFEFLEEGGECRLAHQLQLGRTYQIVVTTGGGLYRYRLGDRVEVVDFLHHCPCIRFVGRVGGVQDRFGEKLTPEAVQPWLPQGLAFVAFEQGRYVVYSDLPGEALQGVVERGERALRRFYHYDLCRNLGQLGCLGGYSLEPGAWQAFYRRMEEMGRRVGDVKPQSLRGEEDWSQWLPGQFLASGDDPA